MRTRPGTSISSTALTARSGCCVAIALLCLAVVAASASAATQTITSAGPLTSIGISDDLNCSVEHASDMQPEFFGGTACATLVATSATLFGPAIIPFGSNAAPRTPFTSVAQTPVSGSGSNANPFTIETTARLGSSGLQLLQTDSYVIGSESYRTDITLTNSNAAARDAILYHAGDCFLQDSDVGNGAVDEDTGAVACTTSTAPDARIEQFFPISPGSHYYEARFSEVWERIGDRLPFPDTCRCDERIDNGAGLSWNVSVPAGDSITRSLLTTFSPLGRNPLATTKTADSATAPGGSSDGYTITISNPNVGAVSLTSITDQLPAGFSYTPGSSSGATTANPAISGRTLTWSGPIVVPAAGPGGPGKITLHFGVRVASQPGTYFNNAGATSAGFTVAPTGDTAQIVVPNPPPTARLAATPTSGIAPLSVSLSTAGTADAQGINSFTLDFGDGSPVVNGTGAPPATFSHVYAVGSHTARLTVTDTGGLTDSATATIAVRPPVVVTIQSGPTGVTADATPQFTFTANVPATFECRVDTAGFAACESPHTTAALASGDHAFEVRGRDGAGSTGAAARRTFTVDTDAPRATITGGPSGATSDDTPAFTFTSDDDPDAEFECRIDAADFESCESPLTTAALAAGDHAFEVRARDAVGNAGEAARRTFTVDTGAPAATITDGPAGVISDDTPTFTFVADEPGSQFECRLDDAAFAGCESPLTAPTLANGDHAFEVRARDGAGNTGAVTRRTFTVDTTPPQVTVVDAPPAETGDDTPTFTFTANEPVTVFECRIDNGEFAACESPLTTAALAPGKHVLEIRARDGAGNIGAPVRYEFTVAGLVTSSVTDRDRDTIPDTPDNCVDRPNTDQRDVDKDGIGDACDTSDASVGPALAKTVIGTVRTGEVFVRFPAGFKPRQAPTTSSSRAGPGFVPVKGAVVLPVGSVVDTMRGRVAIRSVGGNAATTSRKRTTQTSDFYRGVFRIKQARARTPVTEILLHTPNFAKGCPTSSTAKGARAAGSSGSSKKVVNRLWGNGKGNFRTRGRNSTATVRGTQWVTEERCEGTFTRVQRGVVDVLDLRRNHTFRVRAGRGYLARAMRAAVKRRTP